MFAAMTGVIRLYGRGSSSCEAAWPLRTSDERGCPLVFTTTDRLGA